ncbi:hypothetical protein PHYSODRAFT_288708 [Phytophthora sojae]|uniref:RxLR effector protein Avh262 n=2 Tax=Phytophthora sojae TaxID=67593 RepID=AV262_PHYSP|nr:hypothetical protein PHYSODRAFT_288708 [Phytophthora sojae]E0W5H5.1 RecName: Full=RxLR effector protein Avh262; AltName: Full=Avirulence homolog protein 262; Flags: Precursor [Phytophthora sojae]G5A731.1 RecName: Full=RxLR effector protein Avh262; AltName: Full=Avirulence homolog protein 262; Flags: Precursor [Phytophthora sojae strain P6497]AEK81064.1 Avh262 [Phytophthora sojae]AEK81065.1 Avh262 [Phytophthora sojae]AEK81066.1 Avh262 [Phytophthora sojae]EGZ09136.1 hypothetical protein PHYS|eukprot:XP_009535769.1 hypothetical protein PHYSODRAFT_288708 [Phytophthora sojae]
MLPVAVVLVVFAVAVTSAESIHQVNPLPRRRRLKGTEEKGHHTNVNDEERVISLESASDLISKLKVKINAKLLAGDSAKPATLSKAQVASVAKEVVKEVKKTPKVWPPPMIKKGVRRGAGGVR